MKWCVLSICIVSIINFGSVTSSKSKFDCPEAGDIPDPDNCQCFYKCGHVHDEGVKVWCPPETLFHAIERICDYPSDVDCGERPLPGSPTSSTPISSTPAPTTTTTATTTTATTKTTTTATTTSTELDWEGDSTLINILDGTTYFDCHLSFEYKVQDDNVRKIQFRNFSTECFKSTFKDGSIERSGQHRFEFSSKIGASFSCEVIVGMAKGKFLHCLLETLSCSRKPNAACSLPPKTQETRNWQRPRAEFYGRTIIRILQIAQDPQGYTGTGKPLKPSPLDWGLVGHSGRTKPSNWEEHIGYDWLPYDWIHSEFHPVYSKIPCDVPGVYLFFMSPSMSNGNLITPNTNPGRHLQRLMGGIMDHKGYGWNAQDKLDFNADDYIIPFYVGKSDQKNGKIRGRYGQHNNYKYPGIDEFPPSSAAIYNWRTMMLERINDPLQYDLLLTFVKLEDNDQALMLENLLLKMFDFIGNHKQNGGYRFENGCGSHIRGEECVFRPRTAQRNLLVEGEMVNMKTPFSEYVEKIWGSLTDRFKLFLGNTAYASNYTDEKMDFL